MPPARLKVLSAGAVKYAVTDFAARLARETGEEVAFTFGTIGQVRRRLAAGETADVMIGTAPAIAELAQAGVLLAESRTDLGRTFTGVCVRDGAPMPDISTPETFRQAMLAARSLGASPARILLRHLLPNILQPVLVQATIGMAGAILAESTLSFLGVGVLAPMASWGAMLNDARSHLFDAPHMVIFPALAIMVAVLAFNLLGDAFRDWMDPRMRSYLIVTSLTR